jgi:hypothetical protein
MNGGPGKARRLEQAKQVAYGFDVFVINRQDLIRAAVVRRPWGLRCVVGAVRPDPSWNSGTAM